MPHVAALARRSSEILYQILLPPFSFRSNFNSLSFTCDLVCHSHSVGSRHRRWWFFFFLFLFFLIRYFAIFISSYSSSQTEAQSLEKEGRLFSHDQLGYAPRKRTKKPAARSFNRNLRTLYVGTGNKKLPESKDQVTSVDRVLRIYLALRKPWTLSASLQATRRKRSEVPRFAI